MKIGIIGGGLFGRIIGGHLDYLGHNVRIWEVGHTNSGWKAAGCLMKPSWLSKIPRRGECLKLLDLHWGIETVPFKVMNKLVSVDDCWVLRKGVLESQTSSLISMGHAEYISGGIRVRGNASGVKDFPYDLVIDCSGAWSRHATPKWGKSFFIIGKTEAMIRPWRPFTQLVKFNMPKEPWDSYPWVWAGDGSAYKEWTNEIDLSVTRRVQHYLEPKLAVKLDEDTHHWRTVVGARPYAIRKTDLPCQIIRETRNHIHVTGGAKNGTIGAAWAALTLGEELKR